MTGPVTPAAIAQLARAGTTSLQEAADLIQHYAECYASAEVIKAVTKQHNRTMAILEAPSAKVPS